MKRFGDWAVFFATLMAAASVGISALADPVASAASAAPAPAIAVAAPAPAAMAAPASNAAQQAPQSGYLGSEACVVCHENYDRTIEATKHGFKANDRTPAAQQGLRVVPRSGRGARQRPRNVKPIQLDKVSAERRQRAVRQTCHNRGEHALWDGSQHENRNVKCRDCHSVHSSRGPGPDAGQDPAAHLRALPPDHHQQAAALQSHAGARGQDDLLVLPQRAWLDERQAAPRRAPRWIRAAPAATPRSAARSCGSTRRWSTAARPATTRTAATTIACSSAKLPFLCQRCHVTSRHPPTVYEGFTLNNSGNANKMYGKSCANCHQQVHGSNHPNGKFFLR